MTPQNWRALRKRILSHTGLHSSPNLTTILVSEVLQEMDILEQRDPQLLDDKIISLILNLDQEKVEAFAMQRYDNIQWFDILLKEITESLTYGYTDVLEQMQRRKK